jgi:hypothetical protein
MERLHAPNEFFRIRRLREGMRAWKELWRLLTDGSHRLASWGRTTAETPYTAYSYLEGGLMAVRRRPDHDESASPSPSIGRSLPRSRSYVLALLRASPP